MYRITYEQGNNKSPLLRSLKLKSITKKIIKENGLH